MTDRAAELATKLQDYVYVVRNENGGERMVMNDNGIALIRAFEAAIKRATLREAGVMTYEQRQKLLIIAGVMRSHNMHVSAGFLEELAAESKAAIRALDAGASDAPFQSRVNDWMQACFGPEISADKEERNHRFLKEALELVQANGCSQSEAHQLVDYVYGRDQGDINQEVGGVMITLAALCLASGEDMIAAGETELRRIWTKVEQIRAKQAAKPKHSPLPQDNTGASEAPETCQHD